MSRDSQVSPPIVNDSNLTPENSSIALTTGNTPSEASPEIDKKRAEVELAKGIEAEIERAKIGKNLLSVFHVNRAIREATKDDKRIIVLPVNSASKMIDQSQDVINLSRLTEELNGKEIFKDSIIFVAVKPLYSDGKASGHLSMLAIDVAESKIIHFDSSKGNNVDKDGRLKRRVGEDPILTAHSKIIYDNREELFAVLKDIRARLGMEEKGGKMYFNPSVLGKGATLQEGDKHMCGVHSVLSALRYAQERTGLGIVERIFPGLDLEDAQAKLNDPKYFKIFKTAIEELGEQDLGGSSAESSEESLPTQKLYSQRRLVDFVRAGSIGLVTQSLKEGHSPNTKCAETDNPILHIAVIEYFKSQDERREKYLKIIKILFDNHVDLDATNSEGETIDKIIEFGLSDRRLIHNNLIDLFASYSQIWLKRVREEEGLTPAPQLEPKTEVSPQKASQLSGGLGLITLSTINQGESAENSNTALVIEFSSPKLRDKFWNKLTEGLEEPEKLFTKPGSNNIVIPANDLESGCFKIQGEDSKEELVLRLRSEGSPSLRDKFFDLIGLEGNQNIYKRSKDKIIFRGLERPIKIATGHEHASLQI